jgi:hypothetical protein
MCRVPAVSYKVGQLHQPRPLLLLLQGNWPRTIIHPSSLQKPKHILAGSTCSTFQFDSLSSNHLSSPNPNPISISSDLQLYSSSNTLLATATSVSNRRLSTYHPSCKPIARSRGQYASYLLDAPVEGADPIPDRTSSATTKLHQGGKTIRRHQFRFVIPLRPWVVSLLPSSAVYLLLLHVRGFSLCSPFCFVFLEFSSFCLASFAICMHALVAAERWNEKTNEGTSFWILLTLCVLEVMQAIICVNPWPGHSEFAIMP